MTKYMTIAGMFTGAALLSFSVYFYLLTPVFVLAVAGVSAISPRTRPFAWGLYAAAIAAFAFFLVLAMTQGTAPPGVTTYGPGYVE